MKNKFTTLIQNIHLMKTLILFLGLLLMSVSNYAQQTLDGVWNTGMENTTIEIKNGEGQIYSFENQKVTKGKLMIKEINKTNKTNNTYKGKLYIIKKNRWVDAEFVPNGNSLTVTISSGWRSKSLKWNLVKKS